MPSTANIAREAPLRRCAWCQRAIDPFEPGVSSLSEVVLAHDECVARACPAPVRPEAFLPAHRPPLLRAWR